MSGGIPIDKLEVEVQSSGAKVDNSLGRLGQTLERLKSLTAGMVRPLTNLKMGIRGVEIPEKTRAGLERAAATIKRAGETIGKAAEPMREFSSSLDAAKLSKDLSRIDTELGRVDSRIETLRNSLDFLQTPVSGASAIGILGVADEVNDATRRLEELTRVRSLLQDQRAALFAGLENQPSPVPDLERPTRDWAQFGEVMRGILGPLGAVGDKVRELARGAVSLAGRGIEKLGEAVKKTGAMLFSQFTRPVTSAAESLSKWAKAFQRIVFYRVIRAAVKEVTQAIREGTENLYYFSQLAGTQFSSSLDGLASSFLYLKNSLGAMAAPLIQAVAPAVDFVIDKFVALLNTINAALAALTGQSTFTKALRTGAQFGDELSKSLGGAADAAKAIRRQLIGIDELTILQDPSDTGAGGGGGAGLGADYGSMFETVQVPSSISDLADKIKAAISAGDWYGAGAILADKLNGIFDAVPYEDMGKKLGGIIQNGISFALGFIRTFDWTSAGSGIAAGLNGLFDSITPQDLGALLASKIRIGIDLAYGFVTTFDFGKFGVWAAGVLNGWFAEIDAVQLATTISEGIKGAFRAVSTFFSTADFEAIGQQIGQFLAALDWGGIFTGALGTIGNIGGALIDALSGIFQEMDVSDLAAVVGTILTIKIVPKLWEGVSHPFQLFASLTKGSGVSAASAAASAVEGVSTATGTVTAKLSSLAKNLGLGIVVIGEVAIAAGLTVGAVWGIGALLEQVGQAWQPVIENAGTVAAAMGIGTTLLGGVGTAAALLGGAGKTLAVNIGIGTAILLEIGAATGLFIAEVWAVGWGLEQVGQAWQPVLDNGETIKQAILTGTGLLTAVGVVTAALGAVTIGTAGALPLAIGVGTAVLVELSAATVLFTESLVAVADEMTDNLAPALSDFNEVLPDLNTNMGNFKDYMSKFAGLVVAYSGDEIVAGISTAVADIVKFFTGDPLANFTAEVKKTWDMLNGNGKTEGLASLLTKANPVLESAAANSEGYVTSMESLSGVIKDYSGSETVSLISAAVDKIKGWFTTDPLTKFKTEVEDIYKKVAGVDGGEGLDAVLTKTVPVLETANTNATSFMTNLDTLADSLSNYASAGTASGIAESVTTISRWFDGDPLGTLAGVVESNYNALAGSAGGVLGIGATEGLNSRLATVIPELSTAYTSLSSYIGYLNLIAETTSGLTFTGISDAVFVDMTGIGASLVSGFAQGIANAGGVGSPVISGLNDMLNTIGTYDWYSVGTNIGTGIVNGMYNIGQPLAAWGQAVLNEVQRMFAIHSPSDVFADEVGYYMGAGVGVGFKNATPDILSSIADVSDEMQAAIARASVQTPDWSPVYAAAVGPAQSEDIYGGGGDYGDSQSLHAELINMQEEIINAIYAAANQNVNAIRENGERPITINGREIAKVTNDEQYRRMRRLMKSPDYV